MNTSGMMKDVTNTAKNDILFFCDTFNAIKAEIGKMIVGQEQVVSGVLAALCAGGHVLLEGVPGLGKTMLISALSRSVDLPFSRIQFTPDMMPADIQGASVLQELENGGHELTFQPGPIVSNLVLADEINRATPKTQSALLEVMQEKQVTVGRRTIELEEPFCVMATQNPVDQEGTYPLPEAQLDRFLFKLIVGYPTEQDYQLIIDRTTSGQDVTLQAVSNRDALMTMRKIVRDVGVSKSAKDFAIKLVIGTQPFSEYATTSVNNFVSLGASPRGVQSLMLAAKVEALLEGRFEVYANDIRKVALPVLRHRLVLNFKAQASNQTADSLINTLLSEL